MCETPERAPTPSLFSIIFDGIFPTMLGGTHSVVDTQEEREESEVDSNPVFIIWGGAHLVVLREHLPNCA